MKEKLKNMGTWWGRNEDLIEDLEEMGLEVLEHNDEYIVVAYEEDEKDVQLQITLDGTPRTIVIGSVEEIYRG